MAVVGSALEATSFHPGRTARDHLRVLADRRAWRRQRVDEMLELVGISAAARKRAGGYSMGMRQRLGLAAAMLGDPQVLMLDEPANGLDPEGIRWLRGFLRQLAAEGRTVLVSSHMLPEVEQTVDDVVIIASGRLVAAARWPTCAAEARSRSSAPPTSTRSPAPCGSADVTTDRSPDGAPARRDATTAPVGDAAFAAGLPSCTSCARPRPASRRCSSS